MSAVDLTLLLLVAGLAAYLVLGGADFGAGVWDLLSPPGDRDLRGIVERSMTPVWEANHVWLVFVLVVLWTAFPPAFAAVFSTLYVPLFLVAVGIILRGGAFVFRSVATTARQRRALGAVFALSSVVTPFSMGAVIGGIASGRVPADGAGDPLTSWWNPTSVAIGVLVVASGAYLAAVYVAADAASRRIGHVASALRRRALVAGVTTGAIALGGLAVLRADARPLYDDLVGEALPLVLASAACGLATLALVAAHRPGPARWTGGGAVAAVVVAWAVAQRPEILPGALTIEEAAAGEATLAAVLIGLGVGALVLIPSLLLLYRLTLRGRLDPPTHVAGDRDP